PRRTANRSVKKKLPVRAGTSNGNTRRSRFLATFSPTGAPPAPAVALHAKPADKRSEFERRLARKRPAGLAKAIADLKDKLAAEKPTIATRKASELALEV